MSTSARPLPAPLPTDENRAAGLRTSLRNVPLLPAPANVEDLLARLEAEDIPFASGPLAALISDARAFESDVAEDASDTDGFFAPTAYAANMNVRRGGPALTFRPVRAVSHFVRASLLVGAFLVASTALLTESGPAKPAMPLIPLPPLAATAIEAPDFGALSVALAPSSATALPDELVQPLDAVASIETVAVPETGGMAGPMEDLGPQIDEAETVAETEAVSDEAAGGDLAMNDPEGALQDGEALEDAPLPPTRPTGRAKAPFTGIWAASAKACTPTMQRRGALPADINGERGRAGGTTCTFKSVERRGAGWAIAAVCSNGRKTWKSDVRLSLNRGRLTWKSQNGTAKYVRCRGA